MTEDCEDDEVFTLHPDETLRQLVRGNRLHWRHVVRFALSRLYSGAVIVPPEDRTAYMELCVALEASVDRGESD